MCAHLSQTLCAQLSLTLLYGGQARHDCCVQLICAVELMCQAAMSLCGSFHACELLATMSDNIIMLNTVSCLCIDWAADCVWLSTISW